SCSNSTLYVDGTCVTNGDGVAYLPGADVLAGCFSIGSDCTGQAQAHSEIFDLKTSDSELDAPPILADYTIIGSMFYGVSGSGSYLASAPSSPTLSPVFDAVTGAGSLGNPTTNSSGCMIATNACWISNVSAKPASAGTMTVTFTIMGGWNGTNGPFDV